MQPKYFRTKIISLTLVIILLLQSCSIYQKTPVTLDEASKSDTRVLIERTNNEKFKFKRIKNVDGAYFGETKANGDIVSIPLDEKDIKSIRVLDKKRSSLATGGLIVGTLGIGIVIVLLIQVQNEVDNSLPKQIK